MTAMRLKGSILVVWLAVTSAVAPSWAQESSSTIAAGDALRDSGDLAAALEVYKAVRAAAPSAAICLRVAETEDKLGQVAAAHTDYTDLLVDYGSELDAPTRDRIGRRLGQLDRQIGIVRLEDIPGRATVWVDGVQVATTPIIRPIRVARGNHEVVIDCEGYERFVRTVSVGADPVTVTGPMVQANTGSVEIGVSIAPEPLTLFVDGREAGVLPYRGILPPGEHQIWARGLTHGSQPVRIVVVQGQPLRISLVILPLLAPLTLDGQGDGTELLLDGVRVGYGRYEGLLTPGRHTAVFWRPGYQEISVPFSAEPGKALTIVPPGPFVAAAPPAPPPPPTEAARKPQPASSEPPPPPEEDEDDSRDDSGFFGSVILPVQFGASTNAWNDACPTPATLTYTDPTTGFSVAHTVDGSCSSTGPIGGGLQLRMGYNFGWFGIEGAGLALVDVATASIDMANALPGIPEAYGDIAGSTVYVRPGVGLGLGGRLSTPTSGIRATLGVDFGFVQRWVYVVPSDYVGSSVSYTAPLLMLDGGIQLGGVPGGRFYLGVLLWWEFAPDVAFERDMSFLGENIQYPDSLRRVTPYQGTQFFVGPFIGIAFGH